MNGFRGGRGGRGGRGRFFGGAPPPPPPSEEQIREAMRSENVRLSDLRRYDALENAGENGFKFEIRRFVVAASNSSTTSCVVTINSSSFFDFVPSSSLPATLALVLKYVDKDGDVDVELDHVMPDALWIREVLRPLSPLPTTVNLLVVDSILSEDVLDEVLSASVSRLAFERVSCIPCDYAKLSPTILSLHFLGCTNSLVECVLSRRCRSFKRLRNLEVVAEESSIKHYLWHRVLHSLKRISPETEISIELAHEADPIIFWARSLLRLGRISDEQFTDVYDQILSRKAEHERILCCSPAFSDSDSDSGVITDPQDRSGESWPPIAAKKPIVPCVVTLTYRSHPPCIELAGPIAVSSDWAKTRVEKSCEDRKGRDSGNEEETEDVGAE